MRLHYGDDGAVAEHVNRINSWCKWPSIHLLTSRHPTKHSVLRPHGPDDDVDICGRRTPADRRTTILIMPWYSRRSIFKENFVKKKFQEKYQTHVQKEGRYIQRVYIKQVYTSYTFRVVFFVYRLLVSVAATIVY